MPGPLFNVRSVYNFDMYASAILSASYKNATILGIFDAETAIKSGLDAVAVHRNVYPYLPPGSVPDDYRSYDYISIRTETGQTTIIGQAWVKAETITLVQAQVAIALIGITNTTDVQRIKNALAQNGFNNVNISIQP